MLPFGQIGIPLNPWSQCSNDAIQIASGLHLFGFLQSVAVLGRNLRETQGAPPEGYSEKKVFHSY
jgi:hypothetical protein